MHNKKLYGTATVGTKGQLVIPSEAREEYGISTGDRMYVFGSPESGAIILLNEEKLEQFIDKMNLQVESFRALKHKNGNK
ncbi:MAG TPA: AbrB/MazE/SpoVT family DNA-binding domain-containing protein [Candidatus Saccharibacteria bacterium]|nr:AbrB/MazE/SpoVT family DNA-binding domain-containing protein [Candidatus Saccharibacteria bacterium]HRN96938.1 AbrB/MazE/SpoVT family DNA-binding domain-containing protein [Candidatus Saccharibacteria bacterium]HRQ07179.1 AbrB/MazE/SpoVT family DNA-binding domain-containing protein [Candidatus Saccharibacteria bacterium]HRQ97863.1 AbrB/MazE/SpoVT family DNA-binding domain-containing protein [Candidatus Saccharibacteria bacterium]